MERSPVRSPPLHISFFFKNWLFQQKQNQFIIKIVLRIKKDQIVIDGESDILYLQVILFRKPDRKSTKETGKGNIRKKKDSLYWKSGLEREEEINQIPNLGHSLVWQTENFWRTTEKKSKPDAV